MFHILKILYGNKLQYILHINMECATKPQPCGKCVIDLNNEDHLRNTPLISVFLVPMSLMTSGTNWYFKKMRIKDNKITCYGPPNIITSNQISSEPMGSENRRYAIETIRNWYKANEQRSSDDDVKLALEFINKANETFRDNDVASSCLRFVDLIVNYNDKAAECFRKYLQRI